MNIYRGNSFDLNIKIKADNDYINIDEIDLAEFSIGENIKKIYPSPQVTYSNNKFTVKICQEDTLNLKYTFTVQVRVKYKNGYIFASPITEYDLKNSLSKEIL